MIFRSSLLLSSSAATFWTPSAQLPIPFKDRDPGQIGCRMTHDVNTRKVYLLVQGDASSTEFGARLTGEIHV